ncbi:MAG: universal stress protein [Proteobacteria bacterium]|nr:universal stress protein [Pseudomonadota bacterium]
MTRVLAVIDPRETRHHALDRCAEIPTEADLDIHAVLFVEHESAETFSKKFAEKKAWLQKIITPYIANGYRVTCEVVPFDKLYEAVIETANRNKSDLVIKPMRQHSLFQTVVRTTTDWNLIRHCPYPLLLVSEKDKIKGEPIVAAVDVCSGDENHNALNSIVMDEAKRINRVLGGTINLAAAWRASTPMMAVGSVDSTPYPTPGNLLKEHREAAAALAAEHHIAAEQVHLEEGTPSQVINAVAREVDAGVIVIGTVARTGLSGALVGNTAEGVLESSGCDVMVVKLPKA